ncbi:MAG: ATP-dependent DNA helicase RecG [Parcubacteria group bacterium GW2011_GWF1_39_37]|nr:MAG: ATP-dependent DNA helicase RecG [Parcubacteria group bacterium GW2011_GWF1_39_37]
MNLLSPLSEIVRILPNHKKALDKLGLKTVEDLLYYFPVRYGDTSQMKTIESLVKGDDSTVFGRISGLKTSKAFLTSHTLPRWFTRDSLFEWKER